MWPGLGFCHDKKFFCQDSEKKPEKNAVKTGKTGNSRNNFSTLNWTEILWCNYNALLNQLMPVYLVDRLYLSFAVTYQRQILHIWSDSGVVEN